MNPVQRMMAAQGMGGLSGMGGLGELSGWFDEWGDKIITQGFNFGQTFIQAKYAKDAAKFQALNPYTAAQQQQFTQNPNQNVYQNPNDYATGAISSQGIRIGGTLITWPVIGLGGLGLYLIQHSGFQRRR